MATWLCRANYLKFEVHLKNLFLIYLLVLVCCDVGVTAYQPSAKLRQRDGEVKIVKNGGVLWKSAQKALFVEILKSQKKLSTSPLVSLYSTLIWTLLYGEAHIG